MTVKIGDRTYDSTEEMFADMKRRDLEDVPFRLLKPLKAYLRSKSLAGYNLWYWFTEPGKLFTDLPVHYWRRFKWRWTRSKKGYSEFDTWGLDGYLLSWLPDAISDLRANLHSYPTSMYGEGYSMWDTPSQAEADEAFEKWKGILAEIEDGLRAGVRYSDIMIDMTDDERLAERDKFLSAWSLMGEHFFSLWD